MTTFVSTKSFALEMPAIDTLLLFHQTTKSSIIGLNLNHAAFLYGFYYLVPLNVEKVIQIH